MHNFDVGKEVSILFLRIIFEKSKAKFYYNPKLIVSPRLNIICIKFKIMTWHYLQYFSFSYM